MKEALEIRTEGPSLGPEGMHVQHLPGKEAPRRRKIRPAEYARQVHKLGLQITSLQNELTVTKTRLVAALKEAEDLRKGEAVAQSLYDLRGEIGEVRTTLHRLDWPNRFWGWIIGLFQRR